MANQQYMIRKVVGTSLKNPHDIRLFNNACHAAREVGAGKGGNTHITACCNGRIKQAYGFTWRYDK